MSLNAPVPGKAVWWRTVKAVLWSFIGLRRKVDGEQDLESLHPVHIMLVAIAAAVLFVFGLIALVNWVVNRPIGL